uniref:Uncharacterized protein n=1 Tax=Rhizophora mucronata TaxID=61149 RepID=A0A2P2M2D1_RHIMU
MEMNPHAKQIWGIEVKAQQSKTHVVLGSQQLRRKEEKRKSIYLSPWRFGKRRRK